MASTNPETAGLAAITALFELPFTVLIQRASAVHQQNFPQPEVELATLLSIKTGACPEDCAYCPQSAHYKTDIDIERLLPLSRVLAEARAAKQAGAQRFCMGAAWRSPRDKDLAPVLEMVEGVRALGLETCLTAGMLSAAQAQRLVAAGLDYYNHNLDTSPEYYGQIISTRTYQERLDTLEHVRAAGMKLCVGGIVGLGESRRDRARLLEVLASMDPPPESVPINMLVRVEGTPLADQADLDPFEFVRTIAVARLLMPRSRVRLSAGRETMNDALQALCFVAGANSIFYGDKLLTTANAALARDQALLARLGLRPARMAQAQAAEPALCASAQS